MIKDFKAAYQHLRAALIQDGEDKKTTRTTSIAQQYGMERSDVSEHTGHKFVGRRDEWLLILTYKWYDEPKSLRSKNVLSLDLIYDGISMESATVDWLE